MQGENIPLINYHNHKSPNIMVGPSSVLNEDAPYLRNIQGSVFSSIGRGLNAIISSIANVFMAIVSAITNVSFSQDRTKGLRLTYLSGHRNHLQRHRRYSLLSLWPQEEGANPLQ